MEIDPSIPTSQLERLATISYSSVHIVCLGRFYLFSLDYFFMDVIVSSLSLSDAIV